MRGRSQRVCRGRDSQPALRDRSALSHSPAESWEGMQHPSHAQRIEARDRGARTVRRVTLAAGTLAVGVTGVLAALTASATRTSHAAARRVATATKSYGSVPAVPAP